MAHGLLFVCLFFLSARLLSKPFGGCASTLWPFLGNLIPVFFTVMFHRLDRDLYVDGTYICKLELHQKKCMMFLARKTGLTLSVPNFRRHLSSVVCFSFLTNCRLKRSLYVKLKD